LSEETRVTSFAEAGIQAHAAVFPVAGSPLGEDLPEVPPRLQAERVAAITRTAA
jgi:hypothetical protein